MAPIIPAGGRKMDWAPNAEPVAKKAQSVLDDDPQLQAIKDLPGMQDGIAELDTMSAECPQPPCGESLVPDIASPVAVEMTAAPAAGGAVEQAIEKVKDAAQAVADAAVKDVEKAVTDAVKEVGKPKVEEIKPETKAEEKKEDKPESKSEEKKEDKPESKSEEKKEEGKKDDKPDIPGVKDDKAAEIEKEGCLAAAGPRRFKRLAELSSEEVADLKHYWKDVLGMLPEFVDAMFKNYKA